jgi:hypothetical protein
MVRIGEGEGEEKSKSHEKRIFFADGSIEEEEDEGNEKVAEGIPDDASGNEFRLGGCEGIEGSLEKEDEKSEMLWAKSLPGTSDFLSEAQGEDEGCEEGEHVDEEEDDDGKCRDECTPRKESDRGEREMLTDDEVGDGLWLRESFGRIGLGENIPFRILGECACLSDDLRPVCVVTEVGRRRKCRIGEIDAFRE